MERGIGGPLEAASAYYMKSPPKQMRDSVACDLTDAFIQGIDSEGAASEGSPQVVAGE
jgi:myo-inositol-1-phosphate synthase